MTKKAVMPASLISYMKFLFVLGSWELQLYDKHEAKCILRIVGSHAVLFTTFIENLRLCSSAEAGIVLKF